MVGTSLPGRTFACYDDVHVGVQRGRENEQLVPGDAAEAVFDLELRPKGDRDALGPYAQGRPGERFVYLVWVAGPDRTMFRRAKLLLADVPPDVWAAAVASDDGVLEARLGLTDGKGGPRCARVRPDTVAWRAVAR